MAYAPPGANTGAFVSLQGEFVNRTTANETRGQCVAVTASVPAPAKTLRCKHPHIQPPILFLRSLPHAVLLYPYTGEMPSILSPEILPDRPRSSLPAVNMTGCEHVVRLLHLFLSPDIYPRPTGTRILRRQRIGFVDLLVVPCGGCLTSGMHGSHGIHGPFSFPRQTLLSSCYPSDDDCALIKSDAAAGLLCGFSMAELIRPHGLHCLPRAVDWNRGSR